MQAASTLFDLTGKSALITGATGALGGAAARALASAGAHVTLAGGNATRLAALSAELQDSGASVDYIALRPENEAACDEIAAAASRDRNIDIFVSASGTNIVKPALEMSDAEWSSVIDANARQSWLMCRSVGRRFAKQGAGGAVLLISSVRSRFATRAGTSAYGASKAAVDMMTRSLAAEWGEMGVRVNAIAPTVFRSSLTSWLFEDAAADARAEVLKRIPLGRLAEPDDFAGAVIFLCAPASAMVTGQILPVDGGFSCN